MTAASGIVKIKKILRSIVASLLMVVDYALWHAGELMSFPVRVGMGTVE